MPIIIGASIENYYVFSVEGSYREGNIGLVGGPHNWEGRMEIFWNGTWGAISDSQWTVNDARVVCRQLQHAAGSGMITGVSTRSGAHEPHIAGQRSMLHVEQCLILEYN